VPNVRPETASDIAAVRAVNLAAFPTSAEADLVDHLRSEVTPWISLVAEVGAGVVGHILFTPVEVGGRPGLALGPMAVLPEHQGRGVGHALVRKGLDVCHLEGYSLLFVLGHPEYYPRFGFKPAPPLGITCEFECPPEAFMVAELSGGALRGLTGVVRYHAAFNEV
jgi:predicted N-acetyltransferase YhbS